MCDYSLESVSSRDARVGERLVTASFPGTITRGFMSPEEPGTAVCLAPGTELCFENPIKHGGPFASLVRRWRAGAARPAVARFRKIDEDLEHAHHDAIECADGAVIPLTRLRRGQFARVLQLPAEPGASETRTPAVAPARLERIDP